jgi:hypothetical protein
MITEDKILMRVEYYFDFSKAERGRYAMRAKRIKERVNLVEFEKLSADTTTRATGNAVKQN